MSPAQFWTSLSTISLFDLYFIALDYIASERTGKKWTIVALVLYLDQPHINYGHYKHKITDYEMSFLSSPCLHCNTGYPWTAVLLTWNTWNMYFIYVLICYGQFQIMQNNQNRVVEMLQKQHWYILLRSGKHFCSIIKTIAKLQGI